MPKKRKARRLRKQDARLAPKQVDSTSVAVEEPRVAATSTSRDYVGMVFAATVFLSAFLLFQVQPLICKAILHWFGGTPAVWTTSMFFFQVVLLLGYIYAHVTSRCLSPRWQMLVHLALVVAAIVLLPIRPAEIWKPMGLDSHPTWRLIGLLASTVGVQFFLLSTTAPLLQVWWHRIYGDAPYKLYAVSNAGSFLALVSFPFLVERLIGVNMQIWAWSSSFFVVACSLAYCGFRASRTVETETKAQTANTQLGPPTLAQIAAWLVLSTTGSVLLLAMTSHLTQNVAVVPFLWVAPLAIYLLSFILSFADATYYRRWLFGGLMIITYIMTARLYYINEVGNLVLLLAIYLLALFSGCMVCHGELARMKPHAKYLTFYFVIISVGGALGGLFVSIIAPAIFPDYYEYPIVLIVCWVILLTILFRDKTSYLSSGRPIWAWCLIAACCFVFLTQVRNGVIRSAAITVLSRRSFYGVLSVRPHISEDERQQIVLMNGIIKHGVQNLDEESQYEPTAYYARESGLGYAMKLLDEKPKKRVGMLGLGIGTIAAYSGPGDYFRAYEINQDVIDLALDASTFTFWSLLEQRGAKWDVILGDARITLEDELRAGQPQEFDILVVDVFTGDAIPIHLLTVEAFATYVQHLAPDGMIAVHISNRHLDLVPVVQTMAQQFSLTPGLVSFKESRWVILGSPEQIQLLAKQDPQHVHKLGPPHEPQRWTDDFSNIFSVLK